ncbi:MAK10-like protein [Tanacetum coccineum]
MYSFQGLTPKNHSSWHRSLAPSPNFYDHINPATRRTIDQSAGGKLRDKNAKESWALLEDLPLYANESWNDPRDFARPVKAISLPQDVLSTSDHRVIELENQVQCLIEAHLAPKSLIQVNTITFSCEICSGPHDTQYCMKNPEQAFFEYASSRIDEVEGKWYTFKPEQNNLAQTSKEPEKALEDEFKDLHLNLTVLKVLAHAPMYNEILDKFVESLELGKNGSAFIQGIMPEKIKDLRLFTLPCSLGDSKPFDTLANLGSCVDLISLYLFKKLKIGLLEETDHVFGLANGTKSYPVGIVENIEVHIGRLKLLDDFYVIDMDKDPAIPLRVGRGFLSTANAQESYTLRPSTNGIGVRPPYYAKKDFTDYHLPGEWEIARDVKLNPFKDVLVFRRMVKFLGVIPINLKENMWESKELIENMIDWNKPPKGGDGAWYTKIRLIDPDGEEFTKTLQSIPTTRMLFEKENPSEIIDLEHFHDSYECDSESSYKTR